MIRVLHVVTYMGIGGLESMLMNYYRHVDRKKIQFANNSGNRKEGRKRTRCRLAVLRRRENGKFRAV